MARLNKQILGRVSGAVGDIVFREKNGKNFIGIKPSSFMPGNDEASIARRAKFALTAKLASTINSNEELKQLWKNETPAGLSTHNYILRQNYPFVLPGNISGLVKILPYAGFSTIASGLEITDTQIIVNIGPIGSTTGIDLVNEPNCRLYSLIYLHNPVDESVDSNNFMFFTSGDQSTVLDSELTFNFGLSNQDTLLYNKYNSSIVFFVFVTVDITGNIINNSNTLTV